MNLFSRATARAWMIVPLCACGFLLWTNLERAQRVDIVTNTDREDAVVDATSPTGYAGGKRWLIVPEHNNRSYQWISETQQMLARGEWRVRHVDYENAPVGREVHAASPYRWWLGLVAWFEHLVSGRPLGLSVERAALWADPLLHLLLLAGTTLFVARQFGTFPAALLAFGLATIFPFAGGFLPGVPSEQGLARVCALWSVLPLLAGAGLTRRSGAALGADDTTQIEAARMRRFFFIAGVVGGLGLWIAAATQIPILGGIALGGISAALIASRSTRINPAAASPILPWRMWALGGATTCLAAYLIEYFPARLELRLQVNHPLFGLAWVGVGELLAQTDLGLKHRNFFASRRQIMVLAGALAAVAALPITLAVSETQTFLVPDPLAARLTHLPLGVVAKNFSTWIGRDGLTGAVGATCLPLLLLAPAFWLLGRRETGASKRGAIALALGPALVALALAFRQLVWWSTLDAVLLAVLVAATTGLPAAVGMVRRRWLWSGFAGLVFIPGAIQLVPPAASAEKIEFTRFEVEGLIERTLAHWIADRAGPDGAVVLLSPDRTTSWCFHGGLRGLGTANWENRDGLAATVRIVSATTAGEAQTLLGERGVTHLVLLSWDSDLDEFARWTRRNPEDAFVMALHHWAIPTWLQPLPYTLPAIAGFEGQSVSIFKVTDESNRAAAASRLAEYFIETQRFEQAKVAIEVLQRYPTDLGALAGLAQVEKARGNAPGFAQVIGTLVSSLEGGLDRSLAWDRRVSLAIVLALGDRNDLARDQVQRCLERLDEPRLRSLTTASLFRLQVLAKAFGLQISDPKLRELAVKLLPPQLRSRL